MNKKEALFYAQVSQLAYGDDIALNDFRTTSTFEDQETDTQGLFGIAYDHILVIAFRGAEPEKARDLITSLRFLKKPYDPDSAVEVHSGFIDAYKSVRKTILDTVKQSPLERAVCTGHSLGGALATLCAVDLQYKIPKYSPPGKNLTCYTYGSPKVGNKAFASSYNKRVPNTFRVVNGVDLIPWLPRWWQGYRHVKTLHRIGPSLWSWRVFFKGFEDHDLRNYIDSFGSQGVDIN